MWLKISSNSSKSSIFEVFHSLSVVCMGGVSILSDGMNTVSVSPSDCPSEIFCPIRSMSFNDENSLVVKNVGGYTFFRICFLNVNPDEEVIYNEQVRGGSLLGIATSLGRVSALEVSVLHVFQMEEFLEKELGTRLGTGMSCLSVKVLDEVSSRSSCGVRL